MENTISSSPPANPREPGVVPILWALVPALVLPTISALFYFVLFKDATLAKPIYLASKVFTLLWPVGASIWILNRRFKFTGIDVSTHLRSALPGLTIGLAILTLMVIWIKSPWSEIVFAGSDEVRKKVESLGFIDHFLLFAIFITVIHSFIEEFYWRWFVFGNLRRITRLPAAHALAAISFAAHHLIVTCQYYPFWFAFALAGCVAIGGLIWSLLFQRYESLLGPWICHLCVDAGLMWVGFQMIQGNS